MQALFTSKTMEPLRIRHRVLAALLLWIVLPTSALLQETIGFEYGPCDRYGFPCYTFSTLSEGQEAVISDPKADNVYFEIRNMRNKYVGNMGKDPRTYAAPYKTAVSVAQRSLEYPVEFNLHWEDTH